MLSIVKLTLFSLSSSNVRICAEIGRHVISRGGDGNNNNNTFHISILLRQHVSL